MSSPQGKTHPLFKVMKPFAKQIDVKGYSVDKEISLFTADESFKLKKNQINNMYIALSVVALQSTSLSIRYNDEDKFERLMSGQEIIVHKELQHTHKIKGIRQMLIGNKHVDFYLPAFHICLEPSDPKHNARARRASMEEYSDRYNKAMNNLFSIRLENYTTTRQDLGRYMEWLKANRKQTEETINENLYAIACNTIPYFITHKQFSSLLNGTKLHLTQ